MSLTNFWLTAFRIPKKCLGEIEKMCDAFLWSGLEMNTKNSKIRWMEVCKKKTEGGLGIRPLTEVNDVACLKLVWRILSGKNSLWVKWIQIYLIRKGSFWAIRENTTIDSWMWRKIPKVRAVARGFHRVEVKNGEATSFWYDKWSSMGCLWKLLGARGFIDLGISATSTMAEAMQNHRRRCHRHAILNEVEDEVEKPKNENHQAEDVAL